MSFRFRRFLFYSFFIIFIPLSAGIILYSQGWRFNFETFSAQKTGGIYIETEPRDIAIKIDEKYFSDRSGIIQNGTLITDLLPKTYRLTIQKNGYFPYYKNLEIKPSMVSELINTILIPEKIEEIEIMPQRLKGNEITEWDAAHQKIIVKNSKNGVYYLYELNNASSVFNINASVNNFSKESIIKKIAFHPFNENKLIVELESKTKSGLYIFDGNKLKLEPFFLNSQNSLIIAWDIKNSNIHLIKKIAVPKIRLALFSSNLTSKTETELVEMPIKNKKAAEIVKIKVSPSGGRIGVLDALDDLYIFDVKAQNLKQIAHNAGIFAFSYDDKKIAFIDKDGKLNVYFTEDYFKNISKKAGDVIGFNLENKKLIKNIFWRNDSYHLFIEYGGENGKINFMEIDDRPPQNIYPVIERIKDFYYDAEAESFYFIRDEKLYGAD